LPTRKARIRVTVLRAGASREALILLPTSTSSSRHQPARLSRPPGARHDALINLAHPARRFAAAMSSCRSPRSPPAQRRHRAAAAHMSALGAAPDAPSEYLRTKAKGAGDARRPPIARTISARR